MTDKFNINILSNDPMFCTSVATECNKFGFSLTFFEEGEIGNDKLESELLSVNIIDLDIKDSNPYDIAKKLRMTSDLPIFGVFNKFNKQAQAKAKKTGFDLVFTKSMLIKSIKRIIIHVSTEQK
tara:strand:- start:255 stop:626 length:372 start_codon:yes stop_codon:yes gene_type:complete